MTEQPFVSVVTPVYNSVKYIRECVDSVLAQTYENFEYVIVDNCSTDGTTEILREYAERDDRIRLLTPAEFVGPDPNANRALRAISPDSAYVKVIHGDDRLYPHCLELMVGLAVTAPNVGVVGAKRLEDDRISLDGMPESLTVVSGRDACRSCLLGRPWGYLFGSPTSTLLRADLVRARHDFYNLDNPMQSDQEACYEMLYESDFGFVHEVLTFTRRHEEADSTSYQLAGAEIPGQIKMLLTFGPRYLTEEELERRLAVRLAQWAAYVARHPGALLRSDFRSYQAAEIREIFPRIKARSVAAGVGHTLRRVVGRHTRLTRSDP